MPHQSWKFFGCLALVMSLATSGAVTASTIVDDAIKRYYAGYPAEAIEMLRPSASAGNVDAQYLLGNMLYSLANSGQATAPEDPARWYRLAAAQGSAPANYALGAIYNNRWLQFHLDEDARLAQSYFESAQRLGNQEAVTALAKLQSSRNTESLSYTNESFSSKQTVTPNLDKGSRSGKQFVPAKTALTHALSGFQSSGDPLADARNLQHLLSESISGSESAGDTTPNLSTLTQMFGNFESVDKLLSDLVNLYQHIETATELSTAPGSN